MIQVRLAVNPQSVSYYFQLIRQQKFQPPTLFCIKTSIILFNASIFQTPKFRLVSQLVWCMTLVWMIGTFIGTIVQCSAPSFFWDKNQDGACIPNTLLTIGLTSGIISCVGDVVILLMPLPVLAKLNMAKRTKIGLTLLFILGLLYVICLAVLLHHRNSPSQIASSSPALSDGLP